MQNIAIIDFNSEVEIGTILYFRRNLVPLWFPFDQMSYYMHFKFYAELSDYIWVTGWLFLGKIFRQWKIPDRKVTFCAICVNFNNLPLFQTQSHSFSYFLLYHSYKNLHILLECFFSLYFNAAINLFYACNSLEIEATWTFAVWKLIFCKVVLRHLFLDL